jgi:hypothetical protein
MITKKDSTSGSHKQNHYSIILQIVPVLVVAILIIFLVTDKALLTGQVSSGVSIADEYPQHEDITGNINFNLFRGDLIPDNSNITIYISSPRCKSYYFCQDGRKISWEAYDAVTGTCEIINDAPWVDCDETQRNYSSCHSMDHICCNVNQGLGNYYPNLPCASGECRDKCAVVVQNSFSQALYLSGLWNTGNITYGNYHDVNGSGISGTGFGYAAC